MNYVIRAAKPGDLQSIYEMAKLTGGGFTNLPPDRQALRAKLERAEAGFASEKEYPADELYLMVLEDLDSGDRKSYQIVGDDEADIKESKISVNSPIARALIGKTEGDTADVQAPGGVRSFEVVGVRYQ